MPFSWSGAGGGALAGAQLGSIFGSVGTGIGAIGGGLFGGFGRSRSGGSGGGSRGGGLNPFDYLPPELLSGGQENEVVRRLLMFNDTPDQPLGVTSRQALMERIGPNFVPQFFRNDILNPFLQAQFRLGREQLGRDQINQEAQFQRLGAYFSPDLPLATQRLTERQNLAEQDFLGNLGMQGANIAEQLRTDALARALGLESTTQGGLDALLSLNNQRQQIRTGFLTGNVAFPGGEDSTTDPLGFIAGGGLNSTITDLFSRSGAFGGAGGGSDSSGDNGLSALINMAFQSFKKSQLPTNAGIR